MVARKQYDSMEFNERLSSDIGDEMDRAKAFGYDTNQAGKLVGMVTLACAAGVLIFAYGKRRMTRAETQKFAKQVLQLVAEMPDRESPCPK